MSISNNIHNIEHFTHRPVSPSEHAQHAQHAQVIKDEIISQRHVEEGTSPRSNQLTPRTKRSLDVKTVGSISLSKDKPQSLNEVFNAASERINKCVDSPQDESFMAGGITLAYKWEPNSHSQEKAEVYFSKAGNDKIFHCKVENHSDLILPEKFKNNITSKAQKAIDDFIAEHNLVKTPRKDLEFKFNCKKTNSDGEIKISPSFHQSVQDDKKNSLHTIIKLEPFTISLTGEVVGDSIIPPKQLQDLMHKAEKALTEEKYTIKTETKEAEKVPDTKDIAIKDRDDAIKKQNEIIEKLRIELQNEQNKTLDNEGILESKTKTIEKLNFELQNELNRELNCDQDDTSMKLLATKMEQISNNKTFIESKATIEAMAQTTPEKLFAESNFHPVLRPVAKSLGMTLGGILLLVAASPAFADMLKSIIHSSNADTVDEKESIGDYDEVGDNAYNLALENQVNSDKEAYYALQEKEDLNGTLSAEEQKEKERLSQYYSQDGLEPKFSVDNILPEFTDDPHFTEPAEKARTSTIETQKADDLKVMNEATDHSVNETSQKFMPWLIGGGTAALAFAGLRLAKTAAHNLPINHAIRAEQRASADSPYQPGAYINMNMNIDKKIDSHQSRYHNILHI